MKYSMEDISELIDDARLEDTAANNYPSVTAERRRLATQAVQGKALLALAMMEFEKTYRGRT